MPTYRVTDPKTGRTVRLTGDGPPTEAELEQVFASVERDPTWSERLSEAASRTPGVGFAIGAAKGAARTAAHLGRAALDAPAIGPALREVNRTLWGLTPEQQRVAFDEAERLTEPAGASQRVGQIGEQIAEFAVPAAKVGGALSTITTRVLPHMAAQAGVGAGVAAAQGHDPAIGAAAGAAGPVVGKTVEAAGRVIGNRAIPLVRAGLKPTVTAMKQQAGASVSGIDQYAKQLARWIIDNRVTSPDKAQRILEGTERELRTLLRTADATTDAPARAARYLEALRRSAAQQGLPADDVAVISGKAQELLTGPLGEDVTITVMRPTGTLGADGQPVMVPEQQTIRALRNEVPAEEALQIARNTSRWSTRKGWGEQKGASMEADKAVERATRDAVKAAVPGARDLLTRESQAIRARAALDRQAFREGNRDALSLPGLVAAAPELAHGKLPVLGLAAHWLRNNQVRAGIYADRLAKAIRSGNAEETASILNQLGVRLTPPSSVPAEVPASPALIPAPAENTSDLPPQTRVLPSPAELRAAELAQRIRAGQASPEDFLEAQRLLQSRGGR